MSIVRFDPFRQAVRLSENLNRWFEDSLPRSWEPSQLFGGAWTPAVDILENENQLILRAELPGMKAQDVDIRIENSVLTLKGERRLERKEEKDEYHHRERVYGTFLRSFTLPTTIEQDKASAEFRDGVLEIVLPRKEESKPKQIAVNVR